MNGVPGGEKGSIFLSDWIIWEVGYFHLGMTRRNEKPTSQNRDVGHPALW